MVCRNCGRRLRPGPHTAGAVWVSEEDLMPRVRGDMLRVLVVFAIVIAVGLAMGLVLR